jgi:hypothetical protein
MHVSGGIGQWYCLRRQHRGATAIVRVGWQSRLFTEAHPVRPVNPASHGRYHRPISLGSFRAHLKAKFATLVIWPASRELKRKQ